MSARFLEDGWVWLPLLSTIFSACSSCSSSTIFLGGFRAAWHLVWRRQGAALPSATTRVPVPFSSCLGHSAFDRGRAAERHRGATSNAIGQAKVAPVLWMTLRSRVARCCGCGCGTRHPPSSCSCWPLAADWGVASRRDAPSTHTLSAAAAGFAVQLFPTVAVSPSPRTGLFLSVSPSDAFVPPVDQAYNACAARPLCHAPPVPSSLLQFPPSSFLCTLGQPPPLLLLSHTGALHLPPQPWPF